MIKNILAMTASAVLVAGSLAFTAVPANSATKTIYTQCTDSDTYKKLTKKSLGSTTMISCKDLADVSALKGAKRLRLLHLESRSTLKIKGTSKLRGLNIDALYLDTKVSDSKFTFLKDFPRLAELDTGPTNVSTLTNFSRLNKLFYLQLATKSSISFKPLTKISAPFRMQLQVNSGKVDLGSLARLPMLDDVALTGNFNQSVSTLKKSKSLTSVGISKDVRKKLTKGKKHVLPKPIGTYSVANRIGWKLPTGSKRIIVSNGVGAVDVDDQLTTKSGKLSISRWTRYTVYTPGKINFAAPLVPQTKVRSGNSIQVDFRDTDLYNGWDDNMAPCTYQWQRNMKNIKGAKTPAYTATRADIGKTLRLATTCKPHPWLKPLYGFSTNTKYSGAVRVTS